MGAEWIERNTPILNDLALPYVVIRWDAHLEKSTFYQTYRDQLMKSYLTDSTSKKVIEMTINKYLNRQAISLSTEELKEKAKKNCLKYVLEESPILMPLWASQGYDYIIYPKKMTSTMRLSYEQFVLPHYPEKVFWLPLRFRKKSSAEVSSTVL